MPGIASIRARADKEGGGKALDATAVELLLPSHVMDRVDCDMKLFEFEWRFRYAQAHDVLDEIRRFLVLRSRLYRSKERFSRGQYHNTRSVNVLNRVNSKINYSIKKYRQIRVLLLRLSKILMKVGWEAQLKVLQDEDVRPLDEDMRPLDEGDESSVSEGRRVLSWIWKVQGVGSTEEATQEG